MTLLNFSLHSEDFAFFVFRMLKLERHWRFVLWQPGLCVEQPNCAVLGDSGVCFQTREQDVGIWEPLISALLVR